MAGTLLSLSLAACGGGDDSPVPMSDGGSSDASADDAAGPDGDTVDPEDTTGGCTGELRLCDIREADCQRSIAEEVGCLRDSEPLMPAVRLLTEAEYVDSLRDAGFAASDPVTEGWLAGLAAFGLAAAGATPDDRLSMSASRVGAQYQYATRDIVVIDRGMPLDDPAAVATLAHEIVHAQQDEEHALMTWTARWASTDDRMLAAMSVYEGEAVHFQVLVRAALRGDEPSEVDWDAVYDEWQADSYAWHDTAESAYGTAASVLPYAFGGAFVTEAWLRAGSKGIEALYEEPPRSTRAILFGSDEGGPQAQQELHLAALPQVSLAYRPVNYSVLGAFMFRTFLVRRGASEEVALQAAESLGADVFSVMVDRQTGALVSAWRIQLLDGADTSWLGQLELEGFAVLDESPRLTFVTGPDEVLDMVELIKWIAVPQAPPP